MTVRQAIIESIAHHKRMREFAKNQSSDTVVTGTYIKNNLGETYNDSDCTLCSTFNPGLEHSCALCPLCIKYGSCLDNNVENLYRTVGNSIFFPEFFKAETAFIAQLESLLADYPEENEVKA